MDTLGVRGFGTSRSRAELRFQKMVQEAASSLGKVFFVDNDECECIDEDDLFATDMTGWLVPPDRADEFETDQPFDGGQLWRKWSEFFIWVRWTLDDDGALKIHFLSPDEA